MCNKFCIKMVISILDQYAVGSTVWWSSAPDFGKESILANNGQKL